MYTSVNAVSVSISCPDADVAHALGRGLVERRLAACAQLFPIQSIYRWEGKVVDENEYMLQVKTTANRLTALEAFVREQHPYEVPELLALPVTWGSAPYLSWIGEQTRAEE